ncbi:uncharacterized protein LOC134154061 [Rhea pennata]|uniref:uncharacterized protein LOC134154061 n=1 Tax=Rhea pennata TaxID=8795 RepID=UPI002E258E73
MISARAKQLPEDRRGNDGASPSDLFGSAGASDTELSTEQLVGLVLLLQKKVKGLQQRHRRHCAKLEALETVAEQLRREKNLLIRGEAPAPGDGLPRAGARHAVTVLCRTEERALLYAGPKAPCSACRSRERSRPRRRRRLRPVCVVPPPPCPKTPYAGRRPPLPPQPSPGGRGFSGGSSSAERPVSRRWELPPPPPPPPRLRNAGGNGDARTFVGGFIIIIIIIVIIINYSCRAGRGLLQ